MKLCVHSLMHQPIILSVVWCCQLLEFTETKFGPVRTCTPDHQLQIREVLSSFDVGLPSYLGLITEVLIVAHAV